MDFQPIFEQPGTNRLFEEILETNAYQKNSVKTELTHWGITHILMRNDLVTSWYRSLDQQDNEAISLFFKQDAVLLYGSGGYSLFRLR